MIVEQLQGLAHPLKKLKLLPGNPRKGDVEAVKRSYERFGQRKPIVARPDGTVIAGNHQFLAAKALGWDEMAVVFVDDDDQTAKAFALADNRTSDLGSYDSEALAELLADVAVDPELLLATGYTQADLDALIGEIEELPPVVGDPDEVPESAPARTIKGDVWLLGPHRLMCGDSTVPTDVERLMNGEKADMVWTDPPYNVSFAGALSSTSRKGKIVKMSEGYLNPSSTHESIQNDNMDREQFNQFMLSAIATIKDNCTGGYYITFSSATLDELLTPLVQSGIGWKSIIIWNKNQSPMGGGHFRRKYEPIVYGYFENRFYGQPYAEDDVWEVNRTRKNDLHPTMKPVELIEKAIGYSSQKGESVLDLFAGSGSALIAAHGLGRIAYLMELDERYCDIICKRWEQATGITPIHETTKREHSFLD
jgi:DNA modification methylase